MTVFLMHKLNAAFIHRRRHAYFSLPQTVCLTTFNPIPYYVNPNRCIKKQNLKPSALSPEEVPLFGWLLRDGVPEKVSTDHSQVYTEDDSGLMRKMDREVK